jgi:hypothetical protein
VTAVVGVITERVGARLESVQLSKVVLIEIADKNSNFVQIRALAEIHDAAQNDTNR